MATPTWSQIRSQGNITTLIRISEILDQHNTRNKLEFLGIDDQTRITNRQPAYYYAKCKFFYNDQYIITYGEDRYAYAAVENSALACLQILKAIASVDITLQRVVTHCENPALATLPNLVRPSLAPEFALDEDVNRPDTPSPSCARGDADEPDR